MSNHIRILGIAGSLRRGSYNQAALLKYHLFISLCSSLVL
jgi:hypothetical protein